LGNSWIGWPERKCWLLHTSFFAPFVIFFVFSRNLTQLLLAYTLFAVGRALVVPAYDALQADIVPRDMRGRVLGSLDKLNVLAIIPASAIGGVLYDANPSFSFCCRFFRGCGWLGDCISSERAVEARGLISSNRNR
jgi:MFS family permease